MAKKVLASKRAAAKTSRPKKPAGRAGTTAAAAATPTRQIAELRRENEKLHRQIARHEVANFSLKNRVAALEEILQDYGHIENPRLSKYRVPRFSDTPQIEIVLLDRKDLASAGAGETGIVGIAPAVGNAIFVATGTRLRHMPLTPENDMIAS